MKIDAALAPASLSDVPALARAAEAVGFDGVWTSEIQHDPFLPLALVAEHTKRMRFGTAVAIAFARSPTTVAHTAWDLAAASGGRFMLGLGTQVRAHVERRFGMPWPGSPQRQLRQFVAGLHALWRTWQTGERLNLRQDPYKLTLMTPFFNPGPIGHPDIPIFLAGVNPGMLRLAGEIADGLHGHPLHSKRYLTEVVRPALAEGAARTGRDPAEVQLSLTAFVVTDDEEAADVRRQIAFYASTPTYRDVFGLHGWGQVAERLSGLARRGRWDEMANEISDEILGAFAVVTEPGDLPAALLERYGGAADRLTLYRPFLQGETEDEWRGLMKGLRS